MSSLLRYKNAKIKYSLKSTSNSHIYLSFLFIWNWNDKCVHTRPQFPRKPYPIQDQNRQSLDPFPDQNGPKTIPFGGGEAHTYMAYIREYPPPPAPECELQDDDQDRAVRCLRSEHTRWHGHCNKSRRHNQALCSSVLVRATKICCGDKDFHQKKNQFFNTHQAIVAQWTVPTFKLEASGFQARPP